MLRDRGLHVIALDHVQTERNHVDSLIRRVFSLDRVREDNVGAWVAASELALGIRVSWTIILQRSPENMIRLTTMTRPS